MRLRCEVMALPKAYRDWWNDELHPTEPGFREIAGTFDPTLRTLD